MDEDNKCKHGLEKDTCSICLGKIPLKEPSFAVFGFILKAKYEGHCKGCNLPINAPQLIEQNLNTGEWRHVGCH